MSVAPGDALLALGGEVLTGRGRSVLIMGGDALPSSPSRLPEDRGLSALLTASDSRHVSADQRLLKWLSSA